MTNLQNKQTGSTLVEVIVSVFLLTFGVLGLMAAQLRSVASLSEAENRNAVALAAENLADGMQMNPSVQRLATTNGLNIVRRYPDYIRGVTKVNPLDSAVNVLPKSLTGASSWTDDSGSADGITKAQVAQNQLRIFEQGLTQLPNTVDIQYAICLDGAAGEPTYNAGTMNPNCRPAGNGNDKTVIKVLWVVRGDNATSAPVVFTYQLHVSQ